MMFWYGDDGRMGSSAAWVSVLVGAGMVLLVAAVALGLVLVLRRPRRAPAVARTPRQVLAERYARGEIDEPELTTRLATLERVERG